MKFRHALAAVVFCAGVTAAHAQSGCSNCLPCTNSPECPTAVLAVVGAAGVGVARRIGAHRRK